MKKYIAFGISLALALGMVACGQQAPQEPQEPQNVQQTKEVMPSAPPTQTETKPTEEKQEAKTVASPVEESQAIEEEAGTDGEVESPEDSTAEVELFNEVNEVVYVTNTDSVNIRSGPSTDYEKVGSLSWGKEVKRTGIGNKDSEADGWSKVQLSDGSVAFISSKYLSTSKPSSGKSSGATTKPQATTPTGGSSSSSSSTKGADGLTDADRKFIEWAKQQGLNEFGEDTQVDREDLKEHGTTNGGTAIYH